MTEASKFLRERWEEKAVAESGPKKESEAVKIYRKIRAEAEGNPLLERLLQGVEQAALRYQAQVAAWKSAAQELEKSEVFKKAEDVRESAHNAFIAEINMLSRQFSEQGINNEWRRQIGAVGSPDIDRDRIGAFGQEVATYLRAQYFPEEKYESGA